MKAPRHDDDCKAARCIFCGDTMTTTYVLPDGTRAHGPCSALRHDGIPPSVLAECDCGLASEMRRLYDAGFADGSGHDGHGWRGDEIVASLLAEWSGR